MINITGSFDCKEKILWWTSGLSVRITLNWNASCSVHNSEHKPQFSNSKGSERLVSGLLSDATPSTI